MSAPPPETSSDREPLWPLLQRIWRDYLKERRGKLVLSLLAAGVTAASTATVMYLLEPAINGLFVQQSPQALIYIPLAICLVALVRAGASI